MVKMKKINNNANHIPTVFLFCKDCLNGKNCIIEDKTTCDYYIKYINGEYNNIYKKLKHTDINIKDKGINNIFKSKKEIFLKLPIAEFDKTWNVKGDKIGFVNGFVIMDKFNVCCFNDIPLFRIVESIDYFINTSNNKISGNKHYTRLDKSGLNYLKFV